MRSQIERDGAIKGGSPGRLIENLQKAGRFAGPLAGLIMRFPMGGPVWAREHSVGERQLDLRLLPQLGGEASSGVSCLCEVLDVLFRGDEQDLGVHCSNLCNRNLVDPCLGRSRNARA